MNPLQLIHIVVPWAEMVCATLAENIKGFKSTPVFSPFVRALVFTYSNIPCLNQLFQLGFIQQEQLALECFTP